MSQLVAGNALHKLEGQKKEAAGGLDPHQRAKLCPAMLESAVYKVLLDSHGYVTVVREIGGGAFMPIAHYRSVAEFREVELKRRPSDKADSIVDALLARMLIEI